MDLFPGSYCRTSSPLVWVSKLAGEGEQRLGTKPEAKAPNLNVRPPQQQQQQLRHVETASLACTFWLCCSVHTHHGMIVIGNCTVLTRLRLACAGAFLQHGSMVAFGIPGDLELYISKVPNHQWPFVAALLCQVSNISSASLTGSQALSLVGLPQGVRV